MNSLKLNRFVSAHWEVIIRLRNANRRRTEFIHQPRLDSPRHNTARLANGIRPLVRVLVLFFCMTAFHCHAHKLSDAYLQLESTNGTLAGQWDIALRDLEDAIGLDENGDHAITWGEVRARHDLIANYALQHLKVAAAGHAVELHPENQLIDEHSDGAYLVLRFHGELPADLKKLSIRYDLMFDIDPQHRGLLQLRQGDHVQTAVFSPEKSEQTLNLTTPSSFHQFSTFVQEGVHHIWIGIDHILFLLALLLPAVFWRSEDETGETAPEKNIGLFRPSMRRVIKLVTAFTIAHSLTLSLATFNLVSLPSRLVESIIAASVVVVAVNNLWPFFRDRATWVVFVFGLVHGFGFASVLRDLGLPPGSMALSLFGFNLGVEMGQLTVVALFLPVAFLLRDTRFYRQFVFIGGSAVIALVASGWLAERALDLRFF